MDRIRSSSRHFESPIRALALFFASLGLLASCASSGGQTGGGQTGGGQIAFSKAGVTPADREKDENTCLRQSIGLKDQVTILMPFDIDRDAFKSCMLAKGYTAGPK